MAESPNLLPVAVPSPPQSLIRRSESIFYLRTILSQDSLYQHSFTHSFDSLPYPRWPSLHLTDMDTSTLSYTQNKASLPRTSSLLRQPIQPAAEWFTRLTSPLTQSEESPASLRSTPAMAQEPFPAPDAPPQKPDSDGEAGYSTMLLVFIPILVVVLTVLLGLVCFLAAVLYMRRKKGIRWVDRVRWGRDADDGQVDGRRWTAGSVEG